MNLDSRGTVTLTISYGLHYNALNTPVIFSSPWNKGSIEPEPKDSVLHSSDF